MPWTIVRKDGSEKPFCIYKQDDQKSPVGDPVGCHETHEKAVSQLRALYVNVKESIESIQINASQTVAATQLTLGAVHFEADADPRFLRFHDAILARAETNSNHDHIDEDGV